MTYLHSFSAALHDQAVRPPRYGAVAFVARGVRAVLRHSRQMSELRRAQRQLLELDDRLLKDMGLSRDDVRGGSFMTKGEL
jgi:uncharacterized protein YjiS (DUF1127 family)